jgi:hypothetical protein
MKLASWLTAVCMSVVMGSVQAEPNRNAQIETAIDQQLQAFKADDFKTAFEIAAPAIQQRFGTPERFAFVVIHGYPMVWRPTDVQYLGLEQHPDYALQSVMITDHNKTLHILVYEMISVDDVWRIGGVRVVQQRKSET